MRIVETHSDLGGLEHLLIHRARAWADIQQSIAAIDAANSEVEPALAEANLKGELARRGWVPIETSYWELPDSRVILRTTRSVNALSGVMVGERAVNVRHQFQLVRDRIAVEVALRDSGFALFKVLENLLGGYVEDVIDSSVVVLPAGSWTEGVSYEHAIELLSNLGRGGAGVPLVLVGVCP